MTGNARWVYFRHAVLSSFWFVPGLLALSAVALSVVTLSLDRSSLGERIAGSYWLVVAGAESARSILSTIAMSMITVVSLVFSLMLLVLTLVSQQLGPRTIMHFMVDRLNQVVLGVFVATFVYALLVLGAIDDANGTTFIPMLSMNVVLLLTIACLGLLIYFIHHAAMLIQSDDVLAALARTLSREVDALFPEPASEEPLDAVAANIEDASHENRHPVLANASGYIEVISEDTLLKIAGDCDLCIVMHYRAGHFVAEGLPMARAGPVDRVDDGVVERIRDAVVIGPKRTAAQDVQFAVRAIVDIIVRALSPALNDFHTAMAGIDRLAGAMATVMHRSMPKQVLRDRNGTVRVVLYPLTFEIVMFTAFQQVHESARGHFAVCNHLVVALSMLAQLARSDEQRRAIRIHGEIVAGMLKDAPASPYERALADERLEVLWAALGSGVSR